MRAVDVLLALGIGGIFVVILAIELLTIARVVGIGGF